jgi:hypothetical protein
MAKECTGANCSNCEKWKKEYIAPNPDFHYCKNLSQFTRKTFYCNEHESKEELYQRLDDNEFDNEYS